MSDAIADVLMITHRRPEYTARSLRRLLDSADDATRIWVWHNGDHEATRTAVEALRGHPRFHRFHHSAENLRLREPTNWFWRESDGQLVGKVDDDGLMPDGWVATLRRMHSQEPRFGVLGCWRFQASDFDSALASRKIQTYGDVQILRNHWIEGSGYLAKRELISSLGQIRANESFTSYCLRSARAGWINGWAYPFVRQVHLDDPREPESGIKSDEDLARMNPLSLQLGTASSVAEWDAQLRRSARHVQRAPLELWKYSRPVRLIKRSAAKVGWNIGWL